MQTLTLIQKLYSDAVRFMSASAGDPGGDRNEAPDEEVARLKGKTVLVVEDEFLVGLDTAETLRDWGLDVVGPIQTLGEATTKANQIDWDFAILDVNLDGTDTFELARSLLKRNIRVIFVTAYADYDSRFSGDLNKVPRLGKPTPYRALRRLMVDAVRSKK